MGEERIGSVELLALLQATADAWQASRTKSDALDAILGDGDHGSALANAFTGAIAGLPSDATISELLLQTSTQLMNRMGGAAGALFGSFFLGMATACQGQTSLPAGQFAEACAAGLASVKRRSKAELGDKTLLDALGPAVRAWVEQEKHSFSLSFPAAADAADTGAQATIALTAKHGRAKYLGARSSGHMDPGAHSVARMFVAWRDAWEKITRGED